MNKKCCFLSVCSFVSLFIIAGCVSSQPRSHWRFTLESGRALDGGVNLKMLDLWIKDQRLTGTLEMWSSDGLKIFEVPYRRGEEHGISKSWYWDDNGQLASETLFSNGKENGLSRVWRPDGTLFEEMEYEDGLRHGSIIRWNPFGYKILEGKYVNDKAVTVERKERQAGE